ncbi:MAG: 50S ribosomal protein L22 [Planctomycetes bacterium]|nr:50S ribosomal protein L22 [Planctomycetota bacterium]
MKYTAIHRFADVGPRKLRLFADLVRGKNVDEALQLLRFYPNRGAKLVMAVIESAYGNADHLEHPDPDSLVVSECRVDGAPTFKRIQPRARGTAFGILRRMSHIIVALSDPPGSEVETTSEPVATTTATPTTPAPEGTPALPAPATTETPAPATAGA